MAASISPPSQGLKGAERAEECSSSSDEGSEKEQESSSEWLWRAGSSQWRLLFLGSWRRRNMLPLPVSKSRNFRRHHWSGYVIHIIGGGAADCCRNGTTSCREVEWLEWNFSFAIHLQGEGFTHPRAGPGQWGWCRVTSATWEGCTESCLWAELVAMAVEELAL